MGVLSDLTTQTGASTATGTSNQTGAQQSTGTTNQQSASTASGLSNLAGTSSATGTSAQTGTSNLSGTSNVAGVSQTTMPQWYMDAQQALANQAQGAAGAAPALGQTVAQGAINTLSGSTTPFSTATNTLQAISSGAANPWLTGAGGTVTPNTATALGGLFAAQNQQLQQTMPNYTAPVEGANIASGQFGSLRGQTAVNKAKGDALANLFAQQNTAALQNQTTGVNAGIGAGNVAQQGINTAMNVGQEQMTAPLTNIANLGNILAGINAPQTVTSSQTGQTGQTGTTQQTGQTAQTGTTQQTGQTSQTGSQTGSGTTSQSGTSQQTGATSQSGTSSGTVPVLTGLASLGTTSQGVLNALSKLPSTGGSIIDFLKNLGGSGTTLSAGSYQLADGGTMTLNSVGAKEIIDSNGNVTYFDKNTNPIDQETFDNP